MDDAIVLSGDEDDLEIRDIVAEIQQFINVTRTNQEKALQYIHSYNSIEDAITNYFHHEAFGTTGDVGVPDLFNTAIDETVTSTADDADSNIWNDYSGVGSLIGQGGLSSNEEDVMKSGSGGSMSEAGRAAGRGGNSGEEERGRSYSRTSE